MAESRPHADRVSKISQGAREYSLSGGDLTEETRAKAYQVGAAIAYDEGRLVGVLTGTGGITALVTPGIRD